MPAQSASVLAWRDELGALEARLGGLFGRPEPRRQAGLYLEGLLSATKRKNGWQLAEQIGDARPWRTQRVLSHVLWDEEAARDLCRDHAVERLGAEDAALVVALAQRPSSGLPPWKWSSLRDGFEPAGGHEDGKEAAHR